VSIPQIMLRWKMGIGYLNISIIFEITNYFSVASKFLFEYDNDSTQKICMIIEQTDNSVDVFSVNGKKTE